VNASSRAILERLVRADTAQAFNISVGDVKVTGVTQARRPDSPPKTKFCPCELTGGTQASYSNPRIFESVPSPAHRRDTCGPPLRVKEILKPLESPCQSCSAPRLA
jgi:hypothetical protein